MLKALRKGLLFVVLTLLVVAVGSGDYRPSALDLAVAGHRYSLVRWEVSNFPSKWVRKLGDLLPWNSEPSQEERSTQVKEFFALGRDLEDLKRRVVSPQATTDRLLSDEKMRQLRVEIDQIRGRRRALRAGVEESIESQISAVLAQEGLESRIGLIFPPVDTVFSSPPSVLVLSPRDRIARLATILLEPGLDDQERGQIEELVLRDENLTALVNNIVGVATYPSAVSDTSGLRHAVETAAHEWLHHWFFFQPLGQYIWDSPDMNTLNETAATLGGQEIGDRAYTAITGAQVYRGPTPTPAPGAFDFDGEMRETRLRTEGLLTQGQIEEAESHMEERRRFMVANGHFIRKINQAFFAFQDSYATSPASISAVDDQLKELRSRSVSLEEFLKTVADFGSYQEFLDYLEGGKGS